MPSDQSSVNPTRNRGLRFSLRTMLVALVIVCLAVPLIIQSHRLRDAEAELSKLRDETGRLTITDRGKIHVKAVASPEPETWRWRIFIPKGLRYRWSMTAGDIPGKGLPEPTTNAMWNAQGEEADREVLVTASLQQTEKGDWRLYVSSRIGNGKAQMGGARISITDELMNKMRGCEISDVLGSNETKIIDPDKPIILFSRRACETRPDGTQGSTEAPTPGYAIWMSPF